ncbi:Vacuolar cation/proton exchanger 5 [Glycine max]|nr:Vacuolar cation/proton exchanger 5 [Glycine max]
MGNNSNDDESSDISKWETIIWLSVMTAWISILSEYLVGAIELSPAIVLKRFKQFILFFLHPCLCAYLFEVIQGASMAWEIPVAFISVILLPLVGNATEHASAIMFAMKDKLDISLGVAIGSSTQISMFVASIIYLYCMDEIELLYRITVAMIPFCVVIGWITGHPMDLNFQLFETAVLFLTVIVVAFMLQEGTANYFKGLMLILCYLIVATNFYVHVDSSQ